MDDDWESRRQQTTIPYAQCGRIVYGVEGDRSMSTNFVYSNYFANTINKAGQKPGLSVTYQGTAPAYYSRDWVSNVKRVGISWKEVGVNC
jgi:hypothetical protein